MNSVQILLISQNLKLKSIPKFLSHINSKEPVVIISTQYLFDYEKALIESFIMHVHYYIFADFLTDQEMAEIDHHAYLIQNDSLSSYYEEIKIEKNKKIIEKLEEQFHITNRLIASDDLGIDEKTWLSAGYVRVYGEYYYQQNKFSLNNYSVSFINNAIHTIRFYLKKSVYSAKYNGIKYVFYGEMHRVVHRMNIPFKRDKLENYIYIINLILNRIFHTVPCRKNVIHFSTIHESGSFIFFDNRRYQIKILQDGYLPPNYSSLYLKFIKPNESYWVYDYLGAQLFINQNIQVSLLPFRKKKYLPNLRFVSCLKKVLIVTSGAGDWTALKNRSDEDKMAEVFVNLAAHYPNITFVYRCHPVWVHPCHQGVNSINRIAEYFNQTNLPNLQISGNIPQQSLENFQLSISGKSLEADLEGADLVIGEHSIAMLDASFKSIPFASLNVTGRRNFFCGISDMGFPHFETIEELENFIDHFGCLEMQETYTNAIKQYNDMINKELI